MCPTRLLDAEGSAMDRKPIRVRPAAILGRPARRRAPLRRCASSAAAPATRHGPPTAPAATGSAARRAPPEYGSRRWPRPARWHGCRAALRPAAASPRARDPQPHPSRERLPAIPLPPGAPGRTRRTGKRPSRAGEVPHIVDAIPSAVAGLGVLHPVIDRLALECPLTAAIIARDDAPVAGGAIA